MMMNSHRVRSVREWIVSALHADSLSDWRHDFAKYTT